jgi:hypothetical protein
MDMYERKKKQNRETKKETVFACAFNVAYSRGRNPQEIAMNFFHCQANVAFLFYIIFLYLVVKFSSLVYALFKSSLVGDFIHKCIVIGSCFVWFAHIV